MSEHALELAGVERVYNAGEPGEVRVLTGASLAIRPGEVVALVAPSGSGKSTLLHLAGLLDRPDAGSVRIAGEAAEALSDARRTAIRRRDVGFVYQFHHLLKEFSAVENVSLPMRAAGLSARAAARRAAALLDRVGLAPRGHHRPAELSGGEQQRVAICRALANRPRLLLADEPTGNLDGETGKVVMDLLFDLHGRAGTTMLLISHDPVLAERCDRVVTMADGRIAGDRRTGE